MGNSLGHIWVLVETEFEGKDRNSVSSVSVDTKSSQTGMVWSSSVSGMTLIVAKSRSRKPSA